MSTNSVLSELPYIQNIYYWPNKQQFLLAEDTYDNWIMFMVEKGKFHYQIGEETGMATRGDIVLCPPATTLQRSVLETLTFFAITFAMPAIYLEVSQKEAFSAPFTSGKITMLDQQRFLSAIHQLKRIWQQSEQHFLIRKSYLLQDILNILQWEQAEAYYKRTPSDPLMKKAERYMQERVNEKVSLKQLASELGLSAVQFTRRFQARYYTTPSEYLTSLRLHKARSLLVETNLTLEEIAQLCGYDNGFYFSRAFSKKEGIPPSVFRKNNHL